MAVPLSERGRAKPVKQVSQERSLDMLAFLGDRHALSEKPPRLTLIIRRMVVGEPGQLDQRPKRPWVILTKPCPRSLVGTAEGLFGLVNAFLSLLAVAKPYQNRRLDGARPG